MHFPMRQQCQHKPLRFALALLACALVLPLALRAGETAATTSASAPASDYAHIAILSTTDLHGHILPVDYYTGKPDQTTGLAKVATLIKHARNDTPNLLLLDCGDVIQGTPLVYYHNRLNNTPPDPMMLAMNALHYDAMTIGNHEFNFGPAVLNKARDEAHFPWLSANIVRAAAAGAHDGIIATSGSAAATSPFKPYIIKEIDGVRIAILGLTTPGIPDWEDKPNYAGLEFLDPVETARKYVPILREKERADIVIIAMHMGLETDLDIGRPVPNQSSRENTAIEIAKNVLGIDAIFMGHTHRDIPALIINNVLLCQAGKYGDHLIRADIYLEKTLQALEANATVPAARWRITARGARSIAIDEHIPADPEILALAAPYDRETQTWLAKTIGACHRELTATDSRFRSTAIIDLIQRVQLDTARADISFCASFNTAARIPAGDITVRDLCSLYTYENTLVAVELTGAQVKAALEHSARYYRVTTAENGARAIEADPKIPGYNYDMAAGVTYEIAPSRAIGDRIQNLRWQGNPIDPAQKFRVAINNYRLNGGGGYTMFKDAPVLWRSSEEIRDLIIDWVTRHREIPADPINNWRLIEN